MPEQEEQTFPLGVLSHLYNAINQTLTKEDALLLHRMFRCLNQDYQASDDPQTRSQIKVALDLVDEWLDDFDPRDPDL